MKPNTRELLQRLEAADWFYNCGHPLDSSLDAVHINTWKEALAVWTTQASDDARIESQNELTVTLSKHQGLSGWNLTVQELKPLVVGLTERKLAAPAVLGRVPVEGRETVLKALRWDLLGLCLAREYEDLVVTEYHQLLEQLYLAGRWPCGWIGEVPDDMEGAFAMGKLAVL